MLHGISTSDDKISSATWSICCLKIFQRETKLQEPVGRVQFVWKKLRVFICIRNHMIFLAQFWRNKHEEIVQTLRKLHETVGRVQLGVFEKWELIYTKLHEKNLVITS